MNIDIDDAKRAAEALDMAKERMTRAAQAATIVELSTSSPTPSLLFGLASSFGVGTSRAEAGYFMVDSAEIGSFRLTFRFSARS